MGIATVSVFSDPDANAPHVSLADEAYPLGGSTAEETYLDRAKIIDIAVRSGVEAVHPGYGFLSENPEFSRDCASAGLVFIGPDPDTIELLGDKVRSKDGAMRAGVPVVPSSPIWLPGDDKPHDLVSEIGIPLLADSAGKTIHLLERECSVQRRYQKVIEETPSPALDQTLRCAMAESAVAMAVSAGYTNAGTVEFLVDPQTGEYYFLEMNARIQVEHPVTEETLGLDMVELQTRIAAGERLPISQDDGPCSRVSYLR